MNPPLKVLYAEDDENDAFFMRRAFGKLGRPAELEIVFDGRQAVERLSRSLDPALADSARPPMPDLLVLDIKMPVLSGLEVLGWLRERPAFDRLPVVLFTSSTQPADIAISRARGANGYFSKLSNAAALHGLVDALLAALSSEPRHDGPLSVDGNLLAAPETPPGATGASGAPRPTG